MRFLKIFAAASLSLGMLSACGGSGDSVASPPATPQKTVEKPTSEPETSETASPAAATESTAAPEKELSAEFASLPEPYKSADFSRGKRLYKQCSSCHLIGEGAGTLVGPHLNDLFGRKTASVEGFGYSKALEAADFAWTPEQLDQWLANPGSFLPGNAMSFAGVTKERDRVAVIAYIMSETGYEAP